ncbi:MAG TPA: hypothetical protein VGE39_12820, partial [Prosthecobacter sp.]
FLRDGGMSVIMTDMKTKRVSKRSARSRTSKAKAGVAKPKSSAHKKSVAAKPADTFTVRDLNRRPQDVLAAVDTFGSAHVQARSGRRYVIQSEPSLEARADSREAFLNRLDDLHARMREQGSTGFTAEGWETFSKVIAGK